MYGDYEDPKEDKRKDFAVRWDIFKERMKSRAMRLWWKVMAGPVFNAYAVTMLTSPDDKPQTGSLGALMADLNAIGIRNVSWKIMCQRTWPPGPGKIYTVRLRKGLGQHATFLSLKWCAK